MQWENLSDAASWSKWSLLVLSQAGSLCFWNRCGKIGNLPLGVFSNTYNLSFVMRKTPDKLKLAEDPQDAWPVVLKILKVIETKSEAGLQNVKWYPE